VRLGSEAGVLFAWIEHHEIRPFGNAGNLIALRGPPHRSCDAFQLRVYYAAFLLSDIPDANCSVGRMSSQDIFRVSVPLASHHFLGVATQIGIGFHNVLSDTLVAEEPQLA
jgi:hypothetical protein